MKGYWMNSHRRRRGRRGRRPTKFVSCFGLLCVVVFEFIYFTGSNGDNCYFYPGYELRPDRNKWNSFFSSSGRIALACARSRNDGAIHQICCLSAEAVIVYTYTWMSRATRVDAKMIDIKQGVSTSWWWIWKFLSINRHLLSSLRQCDANGCLYCLY